MRRKNIRSLSIKPIPQLIFLVVYATLMPSAWVQKTIGPGDLCEDSSAADIVTFAYAMLESGARQALPIEPQEALTCHLAASLSSLDASGPGVSWQ